LIKVYTDGSSLGNPGNGGWAFLVVRENKISYRSGFEKNTTNNRMELLAAIKALEFLNDCIKFSIITDSKYLKLGITTWIFNWKKNNWKTSTKQPVKNKDLWERLDNLSSRKNINWNWVKAHNTSELNNQVDELARKAAETLTESTFN
tara:strand:- start:1694 stop:2137 length:444 start_codon:yes stop_codon:yes gene_type:complete